MCCARTASPNREPGIERAPRRRRWHGRCVNSNARHVPTFRTRFVPNWRVPYQADACLVLRAVSPARVAAYGPSCRLRRDPGRTGAVRRLLLPPQRRLPVARLMLPLVPRSVERRFRPAGSGVVRRPAVSPSDAWSFGRDQAGSPRQRSPTSEARRGVRAGLRSVRPAKRWSPSLTTRERVSGARQHGLPRPISRY